MKHQGADRGARLRTLVRKPRFVVGIGLFLVLVLMFALTRERSGLPPGPSHDPGSAEAQVESITSIDTVYSCVELQGYTLYSRNVQKVLPLYLCRYGVSDLFSSGEIREECFAVGDARDRQVYGVECPPAGERPLRGVSSTG